MRFSERLSPNREPRGRPIDLVILHYTGMADAKTALARLTDPAPIAGRYPGPWQPADTPPETPLPRVSAHYLIAEDGLIMRLVPEEERAWHAGLGSWAGEAALNDRSIGVELANGGHDYGLPPFPEPQIEAVLALLAVVLPRWRLSRAQVVGHSDVAPERKADPGERFPWARLAAAGFGLWPIAPAWSRLEGLGIGPEEEGPRVAAVQQGLSAFGYGLERNGRQDSLTRACLSAFQRRFRPARITGQADAETLAILDDLLRQAGRSLFAASP